ncbi:MAG: type II toxin-antitoxin system RelE/ParE family toxin [Desulfuromonadaceae bacterium]
MKFKIVVIAAAKSDLREIFHYVELNDSSERADTLVDGVERAIAALTEMPQRGHCPPELDRIGNQDFREIHFKPYRIIYSIRENEVIVHCVLDGRRDMQTLLQQRLLR